MESQLSKDVKSRIVEILQAGDMERDKLIEALLSSFPHTSCRRIRFHYYKLLKDRTVVRVITHDCPSYHNPLLRLNPWRDAAAVS